MGDEQDAPVGGSANYSLLNIDPKSLGEATKEVVDLGVKFLDSLLGKPLKHTGGLLADQIQAWRWSNRVRIAAKAAKMLEDRKVAAKITPPSFLLPLLDAAGNAGDEELQEMWARLLAGGVEGESARHPAFVKVVERMSAADVKFLDGFVRGWEPDQREYLLVDCLDSKDLLPEAATLASLGILASKVMTLSGDPYRHLQVPPAPYDKLALTPFGRLFAQAIMPNEARLIIPQSPGTGAPPPQIITDNRTTW